MVYNKVNQYSSSTISLPFVGYKPITKGANFIMNKIDTVRSAYGFDDPERSKEYYSDDFQATDSVGGPPFDKTGWFGMGDLFRASIPDIDYIIEDIREEGDDVIVAGRFTGTFVNDFDLSAMDMGVIPASGKAVNFPTSTNRISFNGGKISRSHNIDTGPNAGVAGIVSVLRA